MDLWYGQIRSSNYDALRAVYGCDPPWPMAGSPHVDLVRAIQDGRAPTATAFAEYLRLTGRPDLLSERVRVLRGLMESTGPLSIDTSCDSVLDGNHRTAVALVQERAIRRVEHAPYQTIVTPRGTIEGRRLDDRWPIDYDFTGKVVVDLGARDGMNSVRAIQAGAERAILVDNDYTSLAWQVLDAWKLRDRCEVRVEDARDIIAAGDVVLAFSVRHWIGDDALVAQIAGKDCILETHTTDEIPPDSGHRWTPLKEVAYSRAEPTRMRRLYLGQPLGDVFP